MTTTLPQRFWAKVDKTDTCWLWVAAKATNGYGQYYLEGSLRVAHRVAYLDAKGEIPDGLQLDHLCRVRHCVNPDHLEPVTPHENQHRSSITNGGKASCRNGHPYDEENTYLRPDTGHRMCRTCRAERNAKRRPPGWVDSTVVCNVCGKTLKGRSVNRHAFSRRHVRAAVTS